MLKWKQRLGKRECLFLALWAALIALWLVKSAAGRMIAETSRLDAEISAKEARLARLTRLMSGGEAIRKAYAGLSSAGKTDSGALIERIEGIARKAGADIVSLKPVTREGGSAGEASVLRVEIQDNLISIARFFSMVNNGLPGVGVEKVQISAQNREEAARAAFIITSAAR